MGAAVLAFVAFFEGVPFLMADQHHAMIAEPGETGAQGAIVAECPVAVQFDEVVEDETDVVQQTEADWRAARPGPSPRRRDSYRPCE